MIPNQWYPILQSGDLPAGKPVGVRRLGRDLVLWRDMAGVPTCFRDRCCHRQAALSRGRVVEGCLECPYHGLRYDRSGQVVRVPVNGKSYQASPAFSVDQWPLREAHGLLWMWYGTDEPKLSLPWDEGGVEAELDSAHAATVQAGGEFPTNYLRIMENASDLYHVSFVHRMFFGKQTRLDDFVCTREGEQVWVSGVLCEDREDGGGTKFPGRVHLVAPSLLVLHLTSTLGFVATATPIDEHHTWLFARYYNRWLTWPILGRAVAWVMFMVDFWLLQKYQDLPVWRSQRLPDPGRIDEYRPLAADKGIVSFFRIRAELIARAVTQSGRPSPGRTGGLPNIPFGRWGEPP